MPMFASTKPKNSKPRSWRFGKERKNNMNKTKTTEDKTFVARSTKPALLALLIGLALTSFAWLAARAGGGGATHLRWDILHLTVTPQGNILDAGGIAWANAADGSHITLTGSGTWLSV